MPPMIRQAIQLCIEALECPGPEWAPGDKDEAKAMLVHLLNNRFKWDRTDRAIVAAARAVLESDPPKPQE